MSERETAEQWREAVVATLRRLDRDMPHDPSSQTACAVVEAMAKIALEAGLRASVAEHEHAWWKQRAREHEVVVDALRGIILAMRKDGTP